VPSKDIAIDIAKIAYHAYLCIDYEMFRLCTKVVGGSPANGGSCRLLEMVRTDGKYLPLTGISRDLEVLGTLEWHWKPLEVDIKHPGL